MIATNLAISFGTMIFVLAIILRKQPRCCRQFYENLRAQHSRQLMATEKLHEQQMQKQKHDCEQFYDEEMRCERKEFASEINRMKKLLNPKQLERKAKRG